MGRKESRQEIYSVKMVLVSPLAVFLGYCTLNSVLKVLSLCNFSRVEIEIGGRTAPIPYSGIKRTKI